jgi:hypothetical protein
LFDSFQLTAVAIDADKKTTSRRLYFQYVTSLFGKNLHETEQGYPTSNQTAPLHHLGQIQRPSHRASFLLNFFLQKRDRIQELLGPRGASGNINIDRNYLVDPLQ